MSIPRFDHIKIRFRLIKWSVGLVGLTLPVIVWFIASDYFLLSRMNVYWAVLCAVLVTTGIFRLFNNYAADGFAKSYANGGTWEYLASRFDIEKRPSCIDPEDIWSGPSQLDRKDVVFDAEVGASDSGVYININALGRIHIPWDSVSILKKHRLPTQNGWQQMVSIVLDGPEVDLKIPWQTHCDAIVPHTVGIS